MVVWRADLDPDRAASWRAIVSAMPPVTREALPVLIYEVRSWLQHEAHADVADVEGAQAEPDDSSAAARRDERHVLRWRGRADARVVGRDDLRPGDTIVVPARYGGSDRFGWHPDHRDAVEDVAERCLAQLIASYPPNAFRRPKLRLRLHPSLLPQADGSYPRPSARASAVKDALFRATERKGSFTNARAPEAARRGRPCRAASRRSRSSRCTAFPRDRRS